MNRCSRNYKRVGASKKIVIMTNPREQFICDLRRLYMMAEIGPAESKETWQCV
jgi:hypothetical protein